MGPTIFCDESLFCMPHVLQEALDCSFQEPMDEEQLVSWISQDTALSVHVATCYFARHDSQQIGDKAHKLSSLPESIIHDALALLGVEGIRSLLLRLANRQSARQFSDDAWRSSKRFWWRSNYSAKIAKALAILTGGAGAQNQAYLIALVMDVGQLIRLIDDPAFESVWSGILNDAQLIASEQLLPSADHSELAVTNMTAYGWPWLMTTSVRFHHAGLDAIQDAQQMVKLVNVASLLSDPGFDEETFDWQSVEQLLGIKPALLKELRQQLAAELSTNAEQLGLSVNALFDTMDESANAKESDDSSDLIIQKKLALSIGELMHSQQLRQKLLSTDSEERLHSQFESTLCELAGVRNGILFLYEPANDCIKSVHSGRARPIFSIILEKSRSIVCDALLANQCRSVDVQPSSQREFTVVDRQVMDYLNADLLYCVPLTINEQMLGIQVLGVSARQLAVLESQVPDISSRAKMLAACLPLVRERINAAEASKDTIQQMYAEQIRETLHEASNPLTIVSNYLQTMRIKAPENEGLQQDVERISRELSRVSTLLRGLSDKVSSRESVDNVIEDINKIVKSSAAVIDQSLLQNKGIHLSMTLGKGVEGLKSRRTVLQQILTNLLKNAAEAMESGGNIGIETRTLIGSGQQQLVSIDVVDDGPGLPDFVQANLFQAVVSQKEGHSGLGLQIVRKLVEGLDGSIYCRTSDKGTDFQILLPIAETSL